MMICASARLGVAAVIARVAANAALRIAVRIDFLLRKQTG
jgi:hypothetical protein